MIITERQLSLNVTARDEGASVIHILCHSKLFVSHLRVRLSMDSARRRITPNVDSPWTPDLLSTLVYLLKYLPKLYNDLSFISHLSCAFSE